MPTQHTNSMLKEKEKVREFIGNWSKGNHKVLNIVTIPYVGCDIMLDEIIKYVDQGKKVLYITNSSRGFAHILNYFNSKKFKDYLCCDTVSDQADYKASVVICDHETACSDLGMFHLVVYDDVTSYSKYNRFEILDLLSVYYKKDCKIICRSIEIVFKKCPYIEIPSRAQGMPVAEPRIITTRLDISKEIPLVIYDYINWSIKNSRRAVIFVPNMELGKQVHGYLLNFEGKFNNIVLVDEKNGFDAKCGVYITDSIKRLDEQDHCTDYIVYSADDKLFDYKKLMYICSKSERTKTDNMGEVVFLCKEITRDMEFCRDIIRKFNKSAWKKKLLSI